MIKGGFYLKARCIQDSEIAHCAPVVREIWDYLIKEANHADNTRLGIKRGQTFRSIEDIKEALHWYVGYRKMTYTNKQCEGAMKVLRRLGMVVVTKGARGMLITVCKYALYQDFKNYEGSNEGSNEGNTKGNYPSHYKQYTNKEDKERNIVLGDKSPSLTEREGLFHASLVQFLEKYPKEMIRKFFDYWTERNKSGTKMKFELQKTWDTARRLKRWADTETTIVPNANPITTATDELKKLLHGSK